MIMLDNRLNKKQQEAVETTEGRIKIVAGAGSGKTSVLVHRYVYLVNELGIDPNNILCMTFTNKAAAEMKNRIGKMTASSNVNDFVCTIHGFSVKFIRKEGFRIYNRENDLYKFSKRNVHFSPFFRGSSSCLEYQLKGF